MWNRNTFFHLLLVLYYSNLAAQYFFYLAGDSITIFSATVQNLNLFRSARALTYIFPKNPYMLMILKANSLLMAIVLYSFKILPYSCLCMLMTRY
jgi:hypothetical protein